MKWALIAVGGIAIVIAIFVIIGAMLPRNHVAAMTTHVPAPPAAVWAAITDPSQFAHWRPDVQRVELLAPGEHGASWREHTRNGALTMVVDSAQPPTHLVTRIAERNLPFSGSWDYRIVGDGDGASRVTITENGFVSNPVFRFVSRFIIGHTATIDSYLRALAARFGADRSPTVVSPGDSNGI